MKDPTLTSPARGARVGWVLLGLVSLTVLAAWPVLSNEPGFCSLRMNWGLPCALCGGTRALQAVLQGDWARAWYLNPLVFPLLGGALLTGSLLLGEAIRGQRLFQLRTFRFRHVLLGLGALTLFWIAQTYDTVTTPKPELLGRSTWTGQAFQEFIEHVALNR